MSHELQTYAEKKGRKPFDWNKALDDLIAGREPTEKELTNLDNRSRAWALCACGNQCDIIPRYFDGEPKDDTLRHLGVEFMYDIRSGDWREAKETLKKIEVRSVFLIELETKD